MIKAAINGYGRIGRNILRALYEAGLRDDLEVVAINDLGSAETNAHLTRYDSVHGRFPGEVRVEGKNLVVNGDAIRVCAERDPAQLPWSRLGVDLVIESTGQFTKREQAEQHLKAGAKKVLLSAPAKDPVDATIVYGVNHELLDPEKHTVVSNGSCTTNCLAPIAQILHKLAGIEGGVMNTVHSFTNDQNLLDVYHKDLHRARAATMSMIPTTSGAAKAIGLVLPELNGKLDGFAVRVPTPNVSFVDLTVLTERAVTVEDVHRAMREAANGRLKGILAINTEPLVSIDFNHNPHSATYEAGLTHAIGKLVKVCAWYDNEWGFSNRMLDTAAAMFGIARRR
ncbi:MAG: type I glyceraldehyde-3-phosphate dehydrogenase [Gammaproteobacteria bacterium]